MPQLAPLSNSNPDSRLPRQGKPQKKRDSPGAFLKKIDKFSHLPSPLFFAGKTSAQPTLPEFLRPRRQARHSLVRSFGLPRSSSSSAPSQRSPAPQALAAEFSATCGRSGGSGERPWRTPPTGRARGWPGKTEKQGGPKISPDGERCFVKTNNGEGGGGRVPGKSDDLLDEGNTKWPSRAKGSDKSGNKL